MATRAAATAIDWPLFVRMARRHRVEALASRALARSGAPMPAEHAAELAAAASRIAGENLALAAEMARLTRAFGEACIDVLFVKGLSLGALAYDTILLKAGWDIDLIVDKAALQPAAASLQALGYRMTVPAGPSTPARLAAWHNRSKESVWTATDRPITVELHTALADQPALLPGLGARAPRQMVEIVPGVTVPTLAGDELFAYLTVHGASSAWFRLKWLADLGALLSRADAAEIKRLYRKARALGAGRAPAVALLLCQQLFGTRLSQSLAAELGSDRMTRWLVGAAWRSLAGRGVATELGALRAGTIWIHLTQFGLERGLRYKAGELARQVRMMRRFPAADPA